MPFNGLTGEEKETIARLHGDGWKNAAIARHIGRNRTTVVRFLDKRPTRPIDKDLIERLYLAGETMGAIMREARCGSTAIRNVRMERGLRRRRKDIDKDVAVAWFTIARQPVKKIAERLGCTPQTVRNALRDAGIKLKMSPPPRPRARNVAPTLCTA